MKTIDVTKGTNGYPSGTYETRVFESVEELREFQKENTKSLCIFKKRDGWQFWENIGTIDGPFDMFDNAIEDAPDHHDVIKVEKDDTYEDILDTLKQNWDWDDDYDEEVKEWAKRLARRIALSHSLHEDQIFVISYMNDDFIDVYPAEAVEYHDTDVWQYVIGLCDEDA